MEYITLANGYKLPAICYGTGIVDYRSDLNGKIRRKIKHIKKNIISPLRGGAIDIKKIMAL